MGSKQRKLTPEFEHDLIRDPGLGYEPPDTSEFVHCVEHGSPTPLERWHCHDEYELQLIVGALSSGTTLATSSLAIWY